MKTHYIALLSFAIVISYASCDKEELKEEDNIAKKMGILKGTIGLYEGNCMPVVVCVPAPISTTVAITQPSEYFEINLLIDSILTSHDGRFEISLPEGEYSIFLRDGREFICDSWNFTTEAYCRLITIKNDSTTIINANIDHAFW